MRSDAIKALKVLRENFGKDGQMHVMNDVQVTVYTEELTPYSAEELADATREIIRTLKWFPALSEILTLLDGPPMDPKTAAQLAWTIVERAIRRAGRYQGATFLDGAVGSTALQVFGSWPAACSFDTDSPGWAIRRQTFLAIYPTQMGRVSEPVTMTGEHTHAEPLVIGETVGRQPALPPRPSGPLTKAESQSALSEVRNRFLAGRAGAR